VRRLALYVLGILSVSCGKDNGLEPTVPGAIPVAGKCTGAPVIETDATSVIAVSANADMTCTSAYRMFPGDGFGVGGESCDVSGCFPVCVPCPNGTSYALVAWCNHDRCATPSEAACMAAGTPGLAGCSNP
jgi:hypothetical protein